jgi:hypothetical protein
MVHFRGNFICKIMQYIFLKKVKEINLEILTNGLRHTFFYVWLLILFSY